MKRWVCFVLALWCGNCAASVQYTVTGIGHLGVYGSSGSEAMAINNSGQITGCSRTGDSSGEMRPILFDSGVLTDILGVHGQGRAINESGQIVGVTAPGTIFIYTDGAVQYLTGFAPSLRLIDINNSGQVVANKADGHVVVLADGATIDLGTGNGTCINNIGQVAGRSGGRAALWSNDGTTTTDLGDLCGRGSAALDINDKGEAVGFSLFTFSSDREHPVLFKNGQVIDLLGTPEQGQAQAINNDGLIVGRYHCETDEHNRAVGFLYDGQFHDLNSLIPANSGWIIGDAWDINDKGQIVGLGWYNGVSQGYVLTPVAEPPQPPDATVPEPTTLITWTGLIAIGLTWGWRKRRAAQQIT